MNTLDIKLNEAFPGKVVRKDLLHEIKRAVNVPSFVLEFLLSRYCASEDPDEIEEGKKAVLQTIEKNYVRPDESNKAQAIVEQRKRHKFIDKIHVKYVEREKRYWAEMENFASKRIAINPRFYQENEKLLESGIWAEVTLAYNEVEMDDYAFFIEDLRPIQIAHFDAEKFFRGREMFTTDEWIDVLIRSIGIDPEWLAERSRSLNGDKNGRRLKFHILSRFIPLVQSNYNSIELGGRSTGKSYFYSEFSPYSTLLSGGQASTATLLYNNQRKQVGAVGFWDNVAFDEVAKMKIKDADTVQIMKDYMANGRFSRGREVTGYASFSFVGNFDLNIPRIVNSYDHDLLVTLPEAFDLAVIDRIYNYIPGWEIPKIDDSAYNNNFGLITDYMSEALHYLFVHDSEYVGVVNSRLKKGDNIEGRDNRALQKTISGFLKLLFPTGQPTDEEFDEIVEYALEGRRRVKEQLNKRKPDEEYARINMSYVNRFGEKVVVYCPESKYSEATQNPRKEVDIKVLEEPPVVSGPVMSSTIVNDIPISSTSECVENVGPKEKTVDVQYGDTGYSYDDLFTEYLKGESSVMLEEPYLSHGFQMTNLVRFVELLVKIGDCKTFKLITKSCETEEESRFVSDSLTKLRDTLDDMDDCSMRFEYEFDDNAHDRFIRTNSWDITLGRGLHFYQNMNPNKDSRNYFQMGTFDLSLRPCLKARFTFMKRNGGGFINNNADSIHMKTLAIRQPWAMLVAAGIKDVECRENMVPPCKRFLITASTTRDAKRLEDVLPDDLLEEVNGYISRGQLPPYEEWPTGAIIGYADIDRVTYEPVDSPWAYGHEGIKYVLKNAHMLDTPIYGKNKATPFFYNVDGYDEDHLPPAHVINKNK